MAASKSIKIPFTERDLDKAIREHHAEGADLFLYDRGGPKSVGGLVCWVNKAGIEQFQLLKKIQGSFYRRNVGARSITSVTQARTEAGDLIRKLKSGIDPKKETAKAQQLEKLRGLTLRQALEEFLEQAELADKTKYIYGRAVKSTFKGCADKPLPWFTHERVQELHGKRSQESKTTADHDCRVLRLVWNWVRDQKKYQEEDGTPILGPHPVSILNKKTAGKKGWNNVGRRDRIIPKNKLPEWFSAVDQIRKEPGAIESRKNGCNLLEALAITGLRFNELAKLPWTQVDRTLGIITIPDTSSKNRKPLKKPITRRLAEILDDQASDSAFLFPGRSEEDKPIYTTVKLQGEIQNRTGLWITPHDLRRVWASAANRAGLPQLITKRLLNHTSNSQEVTEGYQIQSLDELAEYAQQVEDQILRDADLLQPKESDLLQAFQSLPEEEREKLLQQLQEGRT